VREEELEEAGLVLEEDDLVLEEAGLVLLEEETGLVLLEETGLEVVKVELGGLLVVERVPPEGYVDPIGPNLMFEYVTDELGDAASTSLGTPEVMGHVPRAIPGIVGSTSAGSLESSQSKWAS